MAGVYVPLVLIPRYTTYCGANGTEFTPNGKEELAPWTCPTTTRR